MKKVLIVDGNAQYSRMMMNMGWTVEVSVSPKTIQEADLILFTGGADVSPHYYGEQNIASHCSPRRDEAEKQVFDLAKLAGKPMAGICRGGQFLNVMCGGKMYQDVNNHAIGGTHPALCLLDEEVYQVTSTHHQMMRPSPEARILAVAGLSTVRVYAGADGEPVIERGVTQNDIEACSYGNVLCFQPHPEFNSSSTRLLFFKLLEKVTGL